jgi:D-sedoheptulose 7-phosphate isomerase
MGGEVRILAKRDDYSTTGLIHKMNAAVSAIAPAQGGSRLAYIAKHLLDGADLLRASAHELARDVLNAASLIERCLGAGGKVLICGNGGSAADAQHLAAEFVGRFQRERRGWSAIALSSDSAVLTALGNDFGFHDVFSRQVQALGSAGDVLIAISTSGESPNVLRAAEMARAMGLDVVSLTGATDNSLQSVAGVPLRIPGLDTPLIQVGSIAILHAIVGSLEQPDL